LPVLGAKRNVDAMVDWNDLQSGEGSLSRTGRIGSSDAKAREAE